MAVKLLKEHVVRLSQRAWHPKERKNREFHLCFQSNSNHLLNEPTKKKVDLSMQMTVFLCNCISK